jgi:quercetin dioxygenase-like cupin family protein
VQEGQFVSGRIYTGLVRDAGGIEGQIQAMATGHSPDERIRAKPVRPAADRAAYMLGPGAGEGHWVRGNRFTFKASGREVGDGFAVVETVLHPPAAAPAHLHTGTDEALHILKGEVELEVGGQRFEASPGCFAFLPRGVPHRYLPRDPGPVRALWFLAPSGFEDFWRETGTPIVEGEPPPPPTPPDPERMSELGAKFGTKFLP